MSQEPAAVDVVPVEQPTPAKRVRLARQELHPRLQQQLGQVQHGVGGVPEQAQLLSLISNYYEQLDDERRGIVRSMQLIADEARSYGDGLTGADAAHLQAILEHIKDVVITVA